VFHRLIQNSLKSALAVDSVRKVVCLFGPRQVGKTTLLRRVFEEWAKRDPSLGGTVRIRVTILPDGSVSNAIVVKSTTGNPEFDENIIRYVLRWRFEVANGAGLVEAEIPFAFSGQG